MKLFIQAAIILATAILISACTPAKTLTKSNPCEGVMCTDQFVSVTVHLEDKDGLPIRLEDAYTIRVSTGEVLRYERTGRGEGNYILTDDSYLQFLKNKSDQFQFIGKSNGTEVVSERYTLQADCCHVSRKEGKETIVMEQPR